MIIFFLISLFVLGMLAGYVAVQEQREVGRYCEQVANRNSLAVKMGHSYPSRRFIDMDKKNAGNAVNNAL